MRKLLATVTTAAVLASLTSCHIPKGSGPGAPVPSDGMGSHAKKRSERHKSPTAKRPKRPSHAPSTPRPSASAGRIGKPIENGGLTFTVTRVRNRVRRIGTLLGKKPKGRYTIVYLSVTNSGRKLRIFDAGEQRLIARGRRYKPSASAAIRLQGTSSFTQPLDPGHSVDTAIVFDIPKSIYEPSAIMLRASTLVTPVTVRLS